MSIVGEAGAPPGATSRLTCASSTSMPGEKKIAAVTPLSVRAALTSAGHVTTPVEADALARTGPTYVALYKTEDFLEGRRAEAEGRPPKFRGK